MKIDQRRVEGTFKISKVDAKETEGERKRPEIAVKLAFTTTPKFLDDYLDGHNSGAQPSSVFWREYPGEGTPGDKFIRYTALGACDLVVSPNARYALKVTTKPPEGSEDSGDDYMGYREFLIANVQLKSLQFEVMARACIVVATMEFKPLREQENELMSLRLEPAVLISIWNENGDLFDASNNPNNAEQGNARDERDEVAAEGAAFE